MMKSLGEILLKQGFLLKSSAISGNQTKPFFALLSRLIQKHDMSPLNEEVMPLDFQQLTNTIALPRRSWRD